MAPSSDFVYGLIRTLQKRIEKIEDNPRTTLFLDELIKWDMDCEEKTLVDEKQKQKIEVEKPSMVQKVQKTVHFPIPNPIQTIEGENPKIIQKIAQSKKSIIQENIVKDPKIMEEIVPAHEIVQRLVDVPKIQTVEEIVDVPVVKQAGVPAIQEVERAFEVPQVQFIDKVVNVAVQKQQQYPMTQTFQNKKSIIQEKIVQAPKIIDDLAPVQKIVQRPVDVPQVQNVEELVDVPVVRHEGVPAIQEVQKVVQEGVQSLIDKPVRGDIELMMEIAKRICTASVGAMASTLTTKILENVGVLLKEHEKAAKSRLSDLHLKIMEVKEGLNDLWETFPHKHECDDVPNNSDDEGYF